MFDWVGAYTTATHVLGWSDKEFWEATPRKYFAVLLKVGEIKKSLMQQCTTQEPLVGKDALRALTQIAGKVR